MVETPAVAVVLGDSVGLGDGGDLCGRGDVWRLLAFAFVQSCTRIMYAWD